VVLALQYRRMVVAGAFGLFLISLWGFQFVKPGFMPSSATPQFVVDFWLPEGTTIDQTMEDIVQLEAFVLQLEGVNAVNTTVGGGSLRFMLVYAPESLNSAYGQLLVRVDDHQMIGPMKEKIQSHIESHFPNVQAKAWRFVLGPGGGSKIEATFKGPNPTILRQLAEQAKKIMVEDGGAFFIKDTWRQPVPVIEPIYSEDKGQRAGVSRADLASALATNFTGKTVGVFREGDDLLPIISRAPEQERRDIEDIRNIQVISSVTGKSVPIAQVTDGFRTIWRDGQLRKEDRIWAISAQCDPIEELPSELLARLMPKIEAIPLPDGTTLEWDGEYGDSKESNEDLASTLPLGFLTMVLIVFVLFGSVRQPIVIWLVVPLALIGVVFGLVLAQLPLEFMAILGLLSLSGLLIKNAIVLVDQIDLEIREGKPRFDAIIDSATSRVRPVMMGMLTTVLGVLPLFFDVFFQSMSVVIVFGLTFATVLTLLIVPVLYGMFFKIRKEETRHEIH
jgi:multidrug efflux pump subunit AcrB